VRGTLEKKKPPILGMIQRGGEVLIRMLENVQQQTIEPLIRATITPGTMIYTDEYDIYARLPEWGYGHRTVCHSRSEYARDDDGDGFHEVHVNTMEGFWSLLRSWCIRSRAFFRLPGRRGVGVTDRCGRGGRWAVGG
jgi:transposase